jgi:hypothetical protein
VPVDVVVDRPDGAARVGDRLPGREIEDRLEHELPPDADPQKRTAPLDLHLVEQREVLDASGELGDLGVGELRRERP